jgi:hypothetical protein
VLLGDCVQWFCAEADMQQWQEQVELKLAELFRTSRSFRRMQEIWTTLSLNQPPSYMAYVKQKAATYKKLVQSCDVSLDNAGYGGLRLELDSGNGGMTLLKFVEEKWAKEKAILDADLAACMLEWGGCLSGVSA